VATSGSPTTEQNVRSVESDLWHEIGPDFSSTLEGFTAANKAYTAGDLGTASVECQLVQSTIDHVAVVVSYAGSTDLIELLR
jgi:plastocyanin domain-containing protein